MSELERKMRETIDRQEIWDVLQRYARGLDRIDFDMARSCYFDDAIEDHGSFVGTPDEFVEWALNVSRRFLSTLHHVLNHHCELDGDDAYTETYFQFAGFLEEGPHLLSMGRYIDHFQKRGGQWRIANRVVVTERNLTLGDHPSGMSKPDPTAIGGPISATRDRTDVSYQRPLRPRRPGPRS